MDFISDDVQPPQASSSSPSQSHLKPQLGDLFRHLIPLAIDWKNIGTLLKVEHFKLDCIENNCRNMAQNCLREMLNTWLKQSHPEPTWQAVAEAVELLGDQQKAKEIRDKFIK